jgi:RES domain-containing protein
MLVYRLQNTRYAHELSGEGARLHGGRWNHIGIPCVYAAESRALAVLEFSVNVNIERILRNLSMTSIEIPDDIHQVSISHLPGDWNHYPAPPSTKEFGSHLLNSAQHLIIKIPSSVIPDEYNYLINPRHPGSNLCQIKEVKDFVYDIRIKTV